MGHRYSNSWFSWFFIGCKSVIRYLLLFGEYIHSHTRLRARDQYTSSTLIGGKGIAGPSSLHTTLEGPTECVNAKWIPTCKGHMASYIASNGLCFMVTWTIFKNHLLEVGLTQNREIMVFWTLTTIDLFYFMMCEDTHEEIHWNSIWLRTRSHMTSQYAWGSVTPLHTWFWRCVGTAFGHFLLGSDNFMVTALGSCMKWPSHMIGRPWHSERSEPLVYSILSCVRTRMNINPLK